MEKFPNLIDGQVALLRAQIETGHVLDENYELAINNEQKVYTIFNEISDAVLYAKEIIKEKRDIECVIYDKEEVVLYYFTVDNIN